MRTLIKNGYIINPATGIEGISSVTINEDRIEKIIFDGNDPKDEEFDQVIDAKGLHVLPGFIDLHVHLREPGYTHKETIKTGSLAAAAGGFTTICAMPNTNPATDSPEMVKKVLEIAEKDAKVNVIPVGAITLGQDGNTLTDMKEMVKVGALAVSEDGKSVMDTWLYKKGMELARDCNVPVLAHCEDKSLVGKGVMNAGEKAMELGMEGISNAVEDIITARDILLAKETGAKLHLCHCSTKDSVRMTALAKKDGVKVTAEVCPHHFILTDQDISSDDANFKMNPPLRSKQDVLMLVQGLKDGTVDAISTDHAPHSEEEKAKGIAQAPFGIVGLETAFALSYTELVKKGYLSMFQLVEKMSLNPAKILGIDKGNIDEGCVADLVLVNLEDVYAINKDEFESMGKNTPFHNRTVSGRVVRTIVSGKTVYLKEML